MAGGGFVAHGRGASYEGRVTSFVVCTCLIAATGGLLFGYDLGISGSDFVRLTKFALVYPCYDFVVNIWCLF